MPSNSWSENNSDSDLDPITSLLSDLSDEDFESDFFFQGLEGRRRKAALLLTIIWGGTITLHLVSWGTWLIWGLTTVIGIQVICLLLARPLKTPEPLSDQDQANFSAVISGCLAILVKVVNN
ncbi:MAG: hypothetical protein F6K09_36165 [Merismopedia sp. SIO2A8]|nr:hypothetical protein [Merismopedia sp. SIO2A8]